MFGFVSTRSKRGAKRRASRAERRKSQKRVQYWRGCTGKQARKGRTRWKKRKPKSSGGYL